MTETQKALLVPNYKNLSTDRANIYRERGL